MGVGRLRKGEFGLWGTGDGDVGRDGGSCAEWARGLEDGVPPRCR